MNCQVYDEALERLEGLNEVLASCRINAAADLNDVRAAAQVLDQLEENQLEIETRQPKLRELGCLKRPFFGNPLELFIGFPVESVESRKTFWREYPENPFEFPFFEPVTASTRSNAP